ncbi:nitrite reductase small subunit NirD [Aeromonas media]|uniref:nitrite reductase small subunit NirD n=1 Tax=Aeromonas media TaxID=651 RepID=UPI003D1CB2BF
MSGICELDGGHREQEVEMKALKEDMLPSEHGEWLRVCPLSALPEQAGRSAWLGGRALALFRLGERVYALDAVDPLAGVAVLGRGLVGDYGGEPVVASPLYKQRYALADGRCLDDPALHVACWPVMLSDDEVWVLLG